MRPRIAAELVVLLAGCATPPPPGLVFDLAVDAAPPDLSATCPPTMTSASCDVSGLACNYGATTCVCNTGFWFCNPAACPTEPKAGACTLAGTRCDYGLMTLYCVNGTWLQCGNAVGTRCSNPQAEGAVCCPNEYFGCGCSGGSVCGCTNNKVHCTPCD